jgi:TIR domain
LLKKRPVSGNFAAALPQRPAGAMLVRGVTDAPASGNRGAAVRIFLSYRRGDAGGYAGRLTDALQQRLGPKSVFQDVTAIGPGQDYTAAIDHALRDSDVVLAVIGGGWLSASTPEGARRLLEADDYVRLELSRALLSTVRVVPVLVGGAALPDAADLPSDLQALAQRQTVVLHDETWHQDVDGLLRSLRGEPAAPGRRSRRVPVIAAVAVALAGLGAAAWWLWGPGPGTGPGGSASTIAACGPASGDGWSTIALNANPVGTEKTDGGSLVFRVKAARWRADGGKWQVMLATSMKVNTPGPQYHADYRYSYLVVGQHAFTPVCFSPQGSVAQLVNASTVGDARVGFEVRCKPVGYIRLVIENGKRISVTPDNLQPGPC